MHAHDIDTTCTHWLSHSAQINHLKNASKRSKRDAGKVGSNCTTRAGEIYMCICMCTCVFTSAYTQVCYTCAFYDFRIRRTGAYIYIYIYIYTYTYTYTYTYHQRELSTRLARRLLDIQTLPYIIVINPNIQQVIMCHSSNNSTLHQVRVYIHASYLHTCTCILSSTSRAARRIPVSSACWQIAHWVSSSMASLALKCGKEPAVRA